LRRNTLPSRDVDWRGLQAHHGRGAAINQTAAHMIGVDWGRTKRLHRVAAVSARGT